MSQSTTFGERFGFALWMAHLTTGEVPSYADIGRRVGRTGPAVGAWIAANDPPPDWKVHEPLAKYLGVEDDWLVKGRGEPPDQILWSRWIAHRRGSAKRSPVVPAPDREESVGAVVDRHEKKTAPRKRDRGNSKAS